MPISCRSQAQPSSRSLSPWMLSSALSSTATPRVQRQRHTAHARGLCGIDREAALQAAHRGSRECRRRPARPRRGARRAQGGVALVQVDDHALAQRATGRLQGRDAELRGQRVEQGQAAGDDRPAVVLQAAAGPGGRCGRRAGSARSASAGPAGVITPLSMPLAASTCETAPAVPDEPSASRQCCGANGSSAFLEFGAGGDLRGAKRGGA